MVPLHEVCVVYSGVGCGLRSLGPSHPLPPPLTPSCCWTPTPSVEWTRWSSRWHQRASRRPRKGRPTTLPPSLHPHHPSCHHAMPPTPALPAQGGGVHHHPLHTPAPPPTSAAPRRQVKVPACPWHHPSLFGRPTLGCTPTNPCSQHPSPCLFRTPPAGARWRRGHQPTVRAGNIGAGASESIGTSGGARRGPAACPVVVWDCAVV